MAVIMEIVCRHWHRWSSFYDRLQLGYCIFHKGIKRECYCNSLLPYAMMSRTLGKDLREVIDQVLQMVTFIKTRLLKLRLFEQICTNVESQHRRLALHIDMMWLSIGKVLTRVHELRQELITFFEAMKQSDFFASFYVCFGLKNYNIWHLFFSISLF